MSANIPKHSHLPAQYGSVEISAIATVPVDHDSETAEDRLARRAANWTPTVIHC